MLLQSVLLAESKVGMMMNVHKDNLDNIMSILPALQKPTISNLVNSDFVALNTVIEEKIVRSIIPQLMESGAEGIIEYPLNKVIL